MKEIVLDLAEVSQMASIDDQLLDFGVVGHIGGRSEHTLMPPGPPRNPRITASLRPSIGRALVVH